MQEQRSFPCLAKSSTPIFCDQSEFRKSHRARPEFTAETIRSVKSDDGEMHSGISFDGTRLWNIYEPILWIYDIEESQDVLCVWVRC